MSDASPISLDAVKRGFANPALEAQHLFRQIMNALARPGLVHDLSDAPEPPAGISRAMAGVALTLFDFETSIWLDPMLRGGESEMWLRFHANCPFVTDPTEAEFALVTNIESAPSLFEFNQGDPRYPDRSTTIVMEVASLSEGGNIELQGPGIETTHSIAVTGCPEDFWEQVTTNGDQFQLGVDLFLTNDTRLLGLPRTVQATSN